MPGKGVITYIIQQSGFWKPSTKLRRQNKYKYPVIQTSFAKRFLQPVGELAERRKPTLQVYKRGNAANACPPRSPFSASLLY
jgi:hypothetical protein